MTRVKMDQGKNYCKKDWLKGRKWLKMDGFEVRNSANQILSRTGTIICSVWIASVWREGEPQFSTIFVLLKTMFPNEFFWTLSL